jgi:hypothetical protein
MFSNANLGFGVIALGSEIVCFGGYCFPGKMLSLRLSVSTEIQLLNHKRFQLRARKSKYYLWFARIEPETAE